MEMRWGLFWSGEMWLGLSTAPSSLLFIIRFILFPTYDNRDIGRWTTLQTSPHPRLSVPRKLRKGIAPAGWSSCAAGVLLSSLQPSIRRRCSVSQLLDDDAVLSFQLPVRLCCSLVIARLGCCPVWVGTKTQYPLLGLKQRMAGLLVLLSPRDILY